MKQRTLMIDPKTSFEPRAPTKRAWLSTRKKSFTLGSGDTAVTHPGFFDTDAFGRDSILVFFIILAELFSIAQLKIVGAFENPAVLFALCALDFLCAAFAHCGTAARREYQARLRLARTRDEQVWTGAQHGPRLWQIVVMCIGIIGLFASGVTKSLFFLLNAQFSVIALAIPVIYAVIFWAHLMLTGSWLAEVWHRILHGRDWHRYACGDPDLRFSHPRSLEVRSPVRLGEVAVNRQRLLYDGGDRYILSISGVLQDDEAADLADQQRTDEAKAIVLRACLQFQLKQLHLNPNQDIGNAKGQRLEPQLLLMPVVLIFGAFAFGSCAQPKQKAGAVERVEINLILPNLTDGSLPQSIMELTAPFADGDKAVVSVFRVLGRGENGSEIFEAKLPFDAADARGSFLDQLFGASGIPIDELKSSWLARARKPLAIEKIKRNEETQLSDEDFAKEIISQTAAPAVLLHECRDGSRFGTDARQIKTAADYQSVAIRLLHQKTKNEDGPAVVLLHGFDSPILQTTADPSVEPHGEVSKQTARISPTLRSALPKPVQGIIDRGTATIPLTIYFSTGSSELPLSAMTDFEHLAAIIAKMQNPIVIVTAYSDRRGSDEHKLHLSHDRAIAVAREIQRRNIPVATAIGLGDAMELDKTHTTEGLAFNRRADVIIVEGGDAAAVASAKALPPLR